MDLRKWRGVRYLVVRQRDPFGASSLACKMIASVSDQPVSLDDLSEWLVPGGSALPQSELNAPDRHGSF